MRLSNVGVTDSQTPSVHRMAEPLKECYYHSVLFIIYLLK